MTKVTILCLFAGGLWREIDKNRHQKDSSLVGLTKIHIMNGLDLNKQIYSSVEGLSDLWPFILSDWFPVFKLFCLPSGMDVSNWWCKTDHFPGVSCSGLMSRWRLVAARWQPGGSLVAAWWQPGGSSLGIYGGIGVAAHQGRIYHNLQQLFCNILTLLYQYHEKKTTVRQRFMHT